MQYQELTALLTVSNTALILINTACCRIHLYTRGANQITGPAAFVRDPGD